MTDLLTLILEFVESTFFDPRKRVFVGYLASALLVALIWFWLVQRYHFKQALHLIFARQAWLSASARVDYALLIINRLMMTLISPWLLGQLAVATFLFEWLHFWLSPDSAANWPRWLVIGLFTITLFLLDDCSRYLVHRWLHYSPILWRFHRIHHTATSLNPLTIFRTHPVEGVLFSLRSALVQGLCIGLFVFFFGSGVSLANVLGVNVLLFLFNIAGANLRHSPVCLPYPRSIERWLISPAQHQVHHSMDTAHFDKNFGVILSVWDRLGSTLYYSEANQKLEFGTKERGKEVAHSLWQIYFNPFREIWSQIDPIRLFRRG